MSAATRLEPAVLVLEKRPRWESELKRSAATKGIVVRGCRSAGSLLELSRAMPGSVAVIDLEVGGAASLNCLERARALRRDLDFLPVVVASTDHSDLEWPFRELGALAFLPETMTGDELARLCRRLLAAG